MNQDHAPVAPVSPSVPPQPPVAQQPKQGKGLIYYTILNSYLQCATHGVDLDPVRDVVCSDC